ncbi:CPBP family intramembrane glutamic endopeptidase [Chlorobium ferrooxidans]|uniref:Abortive infection protein n=1 Tax=Chlorobium ferrooxidans DSM 13031 TaxID=377431 RepID=Q0YQP1_9CHLB|nr:CPBP family intramembrane glutamic endopeptidase [Chlorobium ferrooxidans]EAT58580.1 Abortive infection protein [Chlorobium ferrooxidans DSM 13031]
MNTGRQSKRSTIRNLWIFAFIALSIGWIGRGLNVVSGTPVGSEGVGQLLWIAAPLLTALLLRRFGGDGWKDFGFWPELKQRAVWYFLALVLFPLSAALILCIGMVTGLTTLPDLSSAGAAVFLHLFLVTLAPSFVKNIFEEFAWRGYLAPRLSSLGVHDLAGHLLVGVVWAAWHIPYYLFFLDRASFTAYSSQGPMLFFFMLFAGVIAMSLVYGEIRLLTGSVWPLLLLHTVSNAVGNPLLLHDFIRIAPGADIVVSPAPGSIVSIVLNCAVGFGLYRFRKGKGERL